MVEALKVTDIPPLQRIVVAVDPAITASESSDETGIIVAGMCQQGNAYVLKDLSGKYTPNQWARQAIAAYYDFQADRLVAEVNQGGDMVKNIIHSLDGRVSFKNVHATRNKIVRAEPVCALYEQRRVFHMWYGLEKLEEQMCAFVPLRCKQSPDRLDALVWAITELLLSKPPPNRPKVWDALKFTS